jgi:hypothetical protein
MKLLSIACFMLLGVTLVPEGVRAEPTPAPPAPLRYGFEDELVKGDLIRSDVETLVGGRRGARTSLVEVRSSYLPELLKSVEDL